MSLKISKRVLWQYLLLYLVYMMNDSLLYKKYISKANIVLFVLLCFLTFFQRKQRSLYVWGFLGFSLFAVVFERLYSGGVGLEAWLRWGVPVLLVYYTFSIDKEQFLHRWTKLVVFMCIISLAIWLGCQINVDFMRGIMPTHYSMGKSVAYWTSSTNAVYQTEYGDGLFFYSIRYFEPDRNNGVFSEPGLYQMLLNATLFVLLFMGDKVNITNKQQLKYSAIIFITLITCKSTSGYLSFVVIMLMYMMKRNQEEHKNKNRIIVVILLGVAVLLAEYSINGANSILYSQLLRKILMNGKVSLSADTGVWRLMTIASAWESMMAHPLGIGFDRAMALMADGSAGAQIFLMGAALGVVPFVVFQVWTWYPVLISKSISILGKIAFMFMFYNSMLAQSKEFYSVFLIFTIYFRFAGWIQLYREEMRMLNDN